MFDDPSNASLNDFMLILTINLLNNFSTFVDIQVVVQLLWINIQRTLFF